MNRIQQARERGYLNAQRQPDLIAAHSQWCWRLRIPVLWMERCSPYSRFGRVRLDLFTTPRALTASAQEELGALAGRFGTGPPRITAHDACWERVPLARMEDLAGAALCVVNRHGNCRFDLPEPARHPGPAAVLPFRERATA